MMVQEDDVEVDRAEVAGDQDTRHQAEDRGEGGEIGEDPDDRPGDQHVLAAPPDRVGEDVGDDVHDGRRETAAGRV